jgi:hypothetical protein
LLLSSILHFFYLKKLFKKEKIIKENVNTDINNIWKEKYEFILKINDVEGTILQQNLELSQKNFEIKYFLVDLENELSEIKNIMKDLRVFIGDDSKTTFNFNFIKNVNSVNVKERGIIII